MQHRNYLPSVCKTDTLVLCRRLISEHGHDTGMNFYQMLATVGNFAGLLGWVLGPRLS